MIEEANQKWSECLVGYKSFLSMLLTPLRIKFGIQKA